jgi:hypothetical protein
MPLNDYQRKSKGDDAVDLMVPKVPPARFVTWVAAITAGKSFSKSTIKASVSPAACHAIFGCGLTGTDG